MKLIGISGKIGSGKTETSRELVRLTGFVRASFANPVKQEVSQIYGIPLEVCYHHKQWACQLREKYFIDGVEYTPPQTTVRDLLQWHATEIRRKQDLAYWTKQMKRRLNELQDNDCPGVVIDDVRFEDEAEFVKDNGGILVRIDPYVGWESGPAARHSSETALDKYRGWDLRCRPAFGELKDFAGEICKLLK